MAKLFTKAILGRLTLFLALLLLMMMFVACGGGDLSEGDDDDDDFMSDDDDDDDYYDDDDDDNYYDDDDDDYYDDDSADDDSYGDDDDDDDDDDDTPEYECPEDTSPTVLYLSADDSNSQASPVVVRAIINQGDVVPAGKVRTYEFTNYYQINYAAPQFGRINIVPQLRERTETEFEQDYIFQIGAQSHAQSNLERRPLNLVFSLDNSGSMYGAPIELLRDVCRAIAGRLRAGDIVSMVTWNHMQEIELESYEVTGPSDPVLLDVINGLDADGSTDLHNGLVTAYALAAENYSPDKMNRVVLISDGQANTGITDIEIIAAAADDSEAEGTYLVGVGVGEPTYYYNDLLMDDVTDAGKGAYVFIDSEAEAQKQFGDHFLENMEIAAMAVQVRLTMPYYLIMDEYHGEEYSPDPTEVEPQHLGPNDAMVFHQFLVACDAELFNTADLLKVEALYTNPFTREEQVDMTEMTIGEMLAAHAFQLRKGDAIVTFAETLKQIYWLIPYEVEEAYALCQAAQIKVQAAAEELGDEELFEIADLLTRYLSTVAMYK